MYITALIALFFNEEQASHFRGDTNRDPQMVRAAAITVDQSGLMVSQPL